jgi:hypothetical protein
MDLCAGYAAFQTRKQCFDTFRWRIMYRTWLHAAMVGMSASMCDEGNQPAAETQLCTFQGVKPKLMDARLLPAFMLCHGPKCFMHSFEQCVTGIACAVAGLIDLGGYRWPRQANVSQTRHNVKKTQSHKTRSFIIVEIHDLRG